VRPTVMHISPPEMSEKKNPNPIPPENRPWWDRHDKAHMENIGVSTLDKRRCRGEFPTDGKNGRCPLWRNLRWPLDDAEKGDGKAAKIAESDATATASGDRWTFD
jgi:hypothetical protein